MKSSSATSATIRPSTSSAALLSCPIWIPRIFTRRRLFRAESPIQPKLGESRQQFNIGKMSTTGELRNIGAEISPISLSVARIAPIPGQSQNRSPLRQLPESSRHAAGSTRDCRFAPTSFFPFDLPPTFWFFVAA